MEYFTDANIQIADQEPSENVVSPNLRGTMRFSGFSGNLNNEILYLFLQQDMKLQNEHKTHVSGRKHLCPQKDVRTSMEVSASEQG